MMANFLYRNPRILVLTIVTIVVLGVSSLFVMPRLEDPVLGRRVALVSTVFPGANAQRVGSLVSIPLEERLGGISEIRQVRSNSQWGISNVVIELQDEVYNVESVWTVVRNRLLDAKADLPIWAAADTWTPAPTCAHDPTSAWLSTIVPAPMCAPTLT